MCIPNHRCVAVERLGRQALYDDDRLVYEELETKPICFRRVSHSR